jgi:predicted nucleic acid-binding protein
MPTTRKGICKCAFRVFRVFRGLSTLRPEHDQLTDSLIEYAAVTAELRARLFPQAKPSGALAWLAAKSVRVEPMPLRGKLSRDPDDNVFVASAVAAQATFLVRQDRDLLDLEKPFGVRIVTPVEFIRELRL